MKTFVSIWAAFIVLFSLQCTHDPKTSSSGRNPNQAVGVLNGVSLEYPAAQTTDKSYSYFGEIFKNEYESFEVDDGPVARTFVEKQNALTRSVLDTVPRRAEIKGYLDSYAASSAPIPRFFYGQTFIIEKNGIHRVIDGNQKELLVDLTQILEQTQSFDMKNDVPSILDFNLSPDQKHLALLVAFNGRDFDSKIYIVDLGSKRVRSAEVIENALNYTPTFGTFQQTVPVWSEDSTSFIYTRLLTNRDLSGNVNVMLAPVRSELVKHILGAHPETDQVIFDRSGANQKNEIIQVLPSAIKDHVFVTMFNTGYTPNFFGLLNVKTKQVRYYQEGAELYKDHHFGFLGQNGDHLYFRTNFQNKAGAVMKVKWDDFQLKNVSFIATSQVFPLESAFMAKNHIFLITIRNLRHHLQIIDLSGRVLAEPKLPGQGTVSGFSLNENTNVVYFGYSDFTTPRTLVAFNLSQKALEVLDRPVLKFDPNKFMLTRSFVRSRDGKKIPTTEIQLAGTDKKKSLPTYLYFYGNVAAAILPTYNATYNKMLAWVEMGGRVVIAHVRGGTELGPDWSFEGMRLQKMNTMNDVIDVSHALVREKRTTAKQIVLSGRSSAGFASAAAMLLSPDSFGMLSTVVPLTDMLRYQESTCGTRWEVEYGMSSNRGDFNVLKKISPIHISKPDQKIPPTIIFAAEKDDRVPPHHGMKLAAVLQKNSGHLSPVLFYEEPKASHSARKEGLDELSFATLVIPW
ncbi:MAG: prolyl oligopeptidase family serine peptidase [Pseudobdellovibrionaceae bacterium]